MSPKANGRPVNEALFKKEIGRLDKGWRDTNESVKRLVLMLANQGSRIEKLEHNVATNLATKSDIQRVLGAIDAFAQKAEAYDQKALSHGAILQDHEVALRDHGRRLTKLESKP